MGFRVAVESGEMFESTSLLCALNRAVASGYVVLKVTRVEYAGDASAFRVMRVVTLARKG